MPKRYVGELVMLNEQGCEGTMDWCLFIPELRGKSNSLQLIEAGDRLRVFGEGGQVVFDDIIVPDVDSVRECARENCKKVGVDLKFADRVSTWTQKGWHIRDWSNLFARYLRAELTKKGE